VPPSAHLVQLDTAWEDPAANFERVRALLKPVKIVPGDLILMPEMFDTGFSFRHDRTADKGTTLEFMRSLAHDTGALVQGGRTVTSSAERACNVMTAVEPGGAIICEYAKTFLFSPGGEDRWFEPGPGVRTYEWAGATIQPAVCYDLRFPELFRAGVARGATLIALGACWPDVRQHHWRALLIARAIENQAIVLGVNRVGDDPARIPGRPGLHYIGGSIAVSAKGDVLGELGAEPGVLTVPFDDAATLAWREQFPALRDRRDIIR